MSRRLPFALATAVILAACGQQVPSPPITSPASVPSVTSTASPVESATSPGVPADPTPEATIQSFLAFAREPDPSFRAAVTAEYHVGGSVITYDVTAARRGRDVVHDGTETIDGTDAIYGTAVLGGHLYGRDADGWTAASASTDDALLFADNLFSFRHALVIEDLGRDSDTNGYRIRVLAALSLYPPQVAQAAQAAKASDRIEIVISATGLPISAEYSLEVAGATPSDPAAASGTVHYTFSDVGAGLPLSELQLAPGQSMLPAVDVSVAPSPALEPFDLVTVPLTVAVPGSIAITSGSVDNPTLGKLDQTVARAVGPSGASYAAFDLELPASFVKQGDPLAIAQDGISVEARNLGATLVGQRIVRDGPAPAVEAVLATGSAVYRIRITVFEQSWVELGVAGTLQQIAVAEADAFLSSVAAR